MRRNKVCLALLVVSATVAASPPPAAPASPSALWPLPTLAMPESPLPAAVPAGRQDLAALIDLAQQLNPETRQAWNQARAAAAASGLARSAYLPQLALTALGGAEHTPLPSQTPVKGKGYYISDTRQFIPSLTAKWLLFDFGRRDAARDRADAMAFVANVEFTAVHQKLVYSVTKAFYALGAAQGKLRAASDSLGTADIDNRAVAERRRNGVATTVDEARAERRMATAHFAVVRATGAVDSAKAELLAAIGLPAGSNIDVDDGAGPPLPLPPAASVAAYVAEALAARPDIMAAVGRLNAADAAVREAQADFRPTLSTEAKVFQNDGRLRADYGPWSTVHRPGGSVFLSFSWDLFDGGARRSKLAIAKADRDSASDAYAGVRTEAGKQVVQAFIALQSALAAASAAHEVTRAATVSHDAALEGFRHGVATFDELANEADALSEATADEDTARSDAFTAAAALVFATGGDADDSRQPAVPR